MSVRRGVEKSRRQLSFAGTDGGDLELSTCTLCLGRHRVFSTPAKWKSEEARTLAFSLKVAPDSLVCSASRKDITRVLADSTYKPRWEKLKESSKSTTCCIAQCTEIAFALLHRARDELQSTLETTGLKCSISEIPTPTPLCQRHYHLVYKSVQCHQTHCVTCSTSLKHSNPKSCPQPAVIEKYLQENTGYDGHITDHDKVCYACYRAQPLPSLSLHLGVSDSMSPSQSHSYGGSPSSNFLNTDNIRGHLLRQINYDLLQVTVTTGYILTSFEND